VSADMAGNGAITRAALTSREMCAFVTSGSPFWVLAKKIYHLQNHGSILPPLRRQKAEALST
jgi:hypothetical protein